MEKRAKALTWWKGQREAQKTELTKKHFPFANHRYLDGSQVETLFDKVNLGDYNLMSLLTDNRGEAHNPDNYKY